MDNLEQSSSTDEPINLINLRGELVSVPHSQLNGALESGYIHPTSEQVDNHFRHEKYGTISQQAITAAEGAASAATFGASTGLETSLFGIKPEDIRGRREESPWVHGFGQVGSLAVPGLGAAGLEKLGAEGAAKIFGSLGIANNLMTAAGERVAGAFGLGQAVSTAAKIGSPAVKLAIENALFQSGDEVSKMFSKDPDQHLETSIPHIGLAALIGGTLGAGGGALWNSTVGQKLQKYLGALTDHLNSGAEGEELLKSTPEMNPKLNTDFSLNGEIKTEGTSSLVDTEGAIERGGEQTRASLLKNGVPDEAINDAIVKSGMENIPNEIKTAMGQNPKRRFDSQILRESPSKAGIYYRKAIDEFYENSANNIIHALGYTPEELDAFGNISENKVGKGLSDQLEKTLKEQFQPSSDAYADWTSRSAKVDVTQNVQGQIGDNLGLLYQSSGAANLPGTPGAEILEWAMSALPKQKTLENLAQFKTVLMNKIKANPVELSFLKKDIADIITNAEDNLISHGIRSGMVKGSLEEYRAIKAAYGPIRNVLDELDNRLSLPNWNGVKSFIKSMKENLTPEQLLKKLSITNDADLINKILPLFPEVREIVKGYHLNDLINDSVLKARKGEDFNLNRLFIDIKNMSPEMKDFILPEGSLERIRNTKFLMDALPVKLNNSGTAITVFGLMKKHMPASAIAATSLLTGGGAATSAILGGLTSYFSKEAPDAIKLGALKFLGSSSAIDAPGFKMMVDAISQTIKGENLIGKATKEVFSAGQKVSAGILSNNIYPEEKKLQKLDKALQAYQVDPSAMINVASKGSSYMPEQSQSLGALTARAVNYLNGFRPNIDKKGPLDSDIKPSKFQKSIYNQALTIAEQPLVVLKSIKDGTLNTQDVITLKTLYPSLYTKLASQLSQNLIDHLAKGESVPYRTRMALSLFLGQPLDSSMTPNSIQSIQNIYSQMPSPTPKSGHNRVPSSTGMKHLQRIPQLESTPGQRRSMNQSFGKF